MTVAAQHRPRRPAYLRPGMVGLVVLGGTVGTALRDRLEAAFPAPVGHLPWATFAINISGALLLGCLLELLTLVASESGRRQALQLTLGTGLLGGYTTYSTFVLEAVTLATGGSAVPAVGYAVSSVLAGFGAAFVAVTATRRAVRAIRGDQR